MSTACKLLVGGVALFLAACTVSPPVAPPVTLPSQRPAPGRAYDIDSRESLLTILVFRGGVLANAGHNHVIASHALTGTIHVAEGALLQTTFELHLPVAQLTVDEPALREALHREDFPPEVPESARAGTARNMLGESLLDGAHHPEIVLRSAGLSPGADGEVQAQVLATVKGQDHLIHATVHYELQGSALRASGSLSLKQSELGLTPFSALLGALTVQDEMQVRFELKAHAAEAPPL